MYRFILLSLFITNIFANEIYSNKTVNGEFFSKECCHPIKQLKVPTKVKDCTKELFVYFVCNNIERAGFLTNHKEIVDSNTAIMCTDEKVDLIDWSDLLIQKINDVIMIEAKKIPILHHVKDFIGKSFDDLNDYCYVGFIVINNISVILLFVFYLRTRRQPSFPIKNDSDYSLKGEFSINLPLKSMAQLESTCSCSKGDEPCNGRYPCSCRTAGKDCSNECHNGRKVNCCNK